MKHLDIEDALKWVYVEAMPPTQDSTVRPLAKFAMYGTAIDESFWGASTIAIQESPHPDALILDHAVRSLPPVYMTLAIATDLLGHLAPYLARPSPVMQTGIMRRRGREIAGIATRVQCEWHTELRSYAVRPALLIRLCALLNRRPLWDVGPIRTVPMRGLNGRPIIYGGMKGRRYIEGSHTILALDPPGETIAQARFDYAVWHASLVAIVGSCRLTDHRLVGPRAAPTPWIAGPEPERKIWGTERYHHSVSV